MIISLVMRGDDSTALLLGPPGDEGIATASETASFAEALPSTIAPVTTDSSSSSSSVIDMATASATSTTSTSSGLTTSAATPAQTSLPPILGPTDPPHQISSIRYLVPVFILVLITSLAFLYCLYRTKKTKQRRGDIAPKRSEFKQLEEHGEWSEKDIEAENEWTEVPLGSRGWRDTFTGWKSARGRADIPTDESEAARQTIKLVPPTTATSYQTLPDLQLRKQDDRGSIRALRSKLFSLTSFRSEVPEPACIRPRALSPNENILSPPLQPHLFFQPTPAKRERSASQSGSDYSTDEEAGLADASENLSKAYTALPPRVRAGASPKRAKPTPASSRPAPVIVPRKSRKETIEWKAKSTVEDILKASWSDRALVSPTAETLQGASSHGTAGEGVSSPGVEEAETLSGGGGIEQRLAKLRAIDL
ncbi:hypothetical protein P7C73_g6255, partial [Tremellales sp. Uapishka_1]